MMTVREVIKSSAELLCVDLTDKNIANFIHCYNLVENELALDYLPLRAVEKVLIKENKIQYTDLKNKAVRILDIQSVLDCQNEKIKYKLYPKYIELEKNYNGHCFFVRYNYTPKEKVIDDNCDYSLMYEDILKYGVCSEYCLIQGDFEQGAIWSNKYKKAINMQWFKWKTKEIQNG